MGVILMVRKLAESKIREMGFDNKNSLIESIVELRSQEKTLGNIAYELGFVSSKSLRCFCISNNIDINFDKKCTVCGADFSSAIPAKERCSKECSRIAKKKTRQNKEKELKEFITLKCLFCKEEFEPKRKTSKYCSSSCGRKYMGNQRNIKKRVNGEYDDTVTPYEVYCKDSGKCYLCKDDVNWDDKHPGYKTMTCGPKYPTIDHVIPLSKGGTHTWDNVRLACKSCNEKKAEADLDEYLKRIKVLDD